MELNKALESKSIHTQFEGLCEIISTGEFLAAVLHVGTPIFPLENLQPEWLKFVLEKVYDQTRRDGQSSLRALAVRDDFVYSPMVAVAFAQKQDDTPSKVFVSLPADCASSAGQEENSGCRELHAEAALLQAMENNLSVIKNIIVSMSPCTRCVVKILFRFHDFDKKPGIFFLVVLGGDPQKHRHALKSLQLLVDLDYNVRIDKGIMEGVMKDMLRQQAWDKKIDLTEAQAKFNDLVRKGEGKLQKTSLKWSSTIREHSVKFDSLVFVLCTKKTYVFDLADAVFDLLKSIMKNDVYKVELVLFFCFPTATCTVQLIDVFHKTTKPIIWYSIRQSSKTEQKKELLQGPQNSYNRELLQKYKFTEFEKKSEASVKEMIGKKNFQFWKQGIKIKPTENMNTIIEEPSLEQVLRHSQVGNWQDHNNYKRMPIIHHHQQNVNHHNPTIVNNISY